MKLLEDMPSTPTQRPPRRQVHMTLAVLAAILLVAAIGGAILIARSDSSQPTAATVEDANVALADWANTAAATCTATATEHPVLTQTTLAATDVTAAETGLRTLVSAIREQALPVDEAERAQVSAVVTLGEQAETTWAALAAAPADVTTQQVAAASTSSHTFVNGLIELGADCSALAPG